MKRVLLLLVVGVLVLGGCAAPAAAPAKPVVLKLAAKNPVTASPSQALQWWGNEVTKRTNGRVTVEYYWAGALAGTGEELGAIQKRVADGGTVNISDYPDKLPLLSLPYGAVPFGPTDPEILAKVMETVFEHPAVRKEIERYNQKILAVVATDDAAISSKEPFRTLADIKGKKIGAMGTEYQKYLAAIGGVPVSSSAPKRYLELQTGVLDAGMIAYTAIYSFKFYEVAKYVTKLGTGARGTAIITINQDAWKELPADIQKILEQTGKDATRWNVQNIGRMIETGEAEMRKVGAVISDLAFEERQKWATALPEMPREWAKAMNAQGLPGTELLELYLATAKKLGYKFPREWAVR